jgi:hypothetical protein
LVGVPDEFALSFTVRTGLDAVAGFFFNGKTAALFLAFALGAALPGADVRADATFIFVAGAGLTAT